MQYTQNSGVNLYSSSLKTLPAPRYLVFYNGAKDEPDEVVLKLTDAFGENADRKETCLECTATMLNINYGHNRDIMDKCRRLEEYAYFVKTVRDYMDGGHTLNSAIPEAVDECIERGMLKDILMKNRTEVIGMILTSFRDEKYEKAMQEEWKESGLKAGRIEGRKEGLKEGMTRKLLELICKKLKNGKSPERIAQELEEDYEMISDLCNKAAELAPDYDCEALYKILYTESEK